MTHADHPGIIRVVDINAQLLRESALQPNEFFNFIVEFVATYADWVLMVQLGLVDVLKILPVEPFELFSPENEVSIHLDKHTQGQFVFELV